MNMSMQTIYLCKYAIKSKQTRTIKNQKFEKEVARDQSFSAMNKILAQENIEDSGMI